MKQWQREERRRKQNEAEMHRDVCIKWYERGRLGGLDFSYF